MGYQQIYGTLSSVPKVVKEGSLVVTENHETKKFNAMKINKKKTLCSEYQVWETENDDVYVLVEDGSAQR